MRISRPLLLLPALLCSTPPASAAGVTPAVAGARWANLQIPFVENRGLFDARVAYAAGSAAGASFVTRDGELWYRFERRAAEASAMDFRTLANDLARPPRLHTGALPAAALQRAVPASSTAITLSESFVGMRKAAPQGARPSPTKVNYYLGSDPRRWRTGVPAYEEVTLGEVWPGIEVALRARLRTVEKVFTVRPGADPAQIRMRVGGATALTLAASGQLLLRSGSTPVRLSRPVAFQDVDGARRDVEVAYAVDGATYGFRLGAYDRTRPLVIDPLIRATYAGGDNDELSDMNMAVDPAGGSLFIAMRTFSAAFPGAAGSLNGGSDGLVLRINSTLSTLVNATYVGGSVDDFNGLGNGAVVVGANSVYVVSRTSSGDFPGTAGAAQAALAGGQDLVIARFNKNLELVRSSFYGGSSLEQARGARLNPVNGHLYILGFSYSTDLPGTAAGVQPALANPGSGTADVFVARFTADLSKIQSATYFGGSAEDETFGGGIDFNASSGDPYILGYTESADLPGTAGAAQAAFVGSPASTLGGSGTGSDGFVAWLNPNLGILNRTTYVGGSGSEGARELLVHPATGEIYAALGQTGSVDFPHTTGGAIPANTTVVAGVVARLSGDLTQFLQSTYLGAGIVRDLALDAASGDLLVGGETSEENMPGSANGAQNLVNLTGAGTVVDPETGALSFPLDVYVMRLSGDLTVLRQSTYFGGTGSEEPFGMCDLLLHPVNGSLYLFGDTLSSDLQLTRFAVQPAPGGGSDVYVARMDPALTGSDTAPDAFTLGAIGPVAPGTTVTSAPITVSGVAAPAAISVAGGSYSINDGPTTPYGGAVDHGDQVRVQHVAGATSGQVVASTLTIGNVAATFTSTVGDATPDPFTLGTRSGRPTGVLVTSGIVTVGGIDVPVAAAVAGGEVAINDGAFGAGGAVNAGDAVRVRVRSATTANTATAATLTIGGVGATFNVITGSADTTPDPFTFPALVDVVAGREQRSEFILVGGINATVNARVTGGAMSIDGGPFVTAITPVAAGARIQVRHTSAATPVTLTSTVLTVGGVAAAFDSTTAP